MPVTTLHKLIGLSVAMLGQAPGTDLLNQWTRLYTQSREDGMDAMAALQKVAQHILDSDAFAEVHPAYLIIDNQDFAQRFLNQILGETASAEMVTLVVGLLDAGTSRAEVAVRAVEYLLVVNHQGTDHPDHGTFGTYAMRFGNQVEVARYYTVDKVWMTPNESVLAGVDGTAASVTAAKVSIDGMQQPGKNFALTTGVDQFTGTPGDDTFVATESTLNGADRLNGKAGMDTLELSSGSGANADISIPVGATVSHIETLSVTSDGKFTGDVSKWEGLKTVQLEVVENVDLELDADAGIKVTSESLGNDDKASEVTIENAGMVALEDVNAKATVKITGEGTESVMVEGGKSVHVNTKASPSTTVNSVTVDGVARDNGEDGKRDGTTGASTAAKDKDKASVEVYSKALANIALHNTDAIVLLQNDATDMTELTAMVNKFGLSASMMGKLCLQGIEDLMLQVAGASYFDLASNEIKSIDVSGAGNLTLDVNQFDNSKASTTLESLMLSGSGKFTMKDASGLSKLKTIDAGDATGDVSITKLGNGVTSYTGSSGKDMISVAAFNSKGLMANLGAGDDTFTVNNAGAGKSKIDGGVGMDTLVLKQTDGAKVKGAGDTYMNFETITLEAGGGKGTYDLKGLDIDELKISSSVGAAAGVKFKNVTPGTDLTVSSSATGNTLAIVDYTLPESSQGSRFGSSGNSTLNLNLHAMGGKDDTTATAEDVGKRGVLMQLSVDDDIDTVTVDSNAMLNKANANKVKTMNYINTVVFMDESGGGAGDKIKQIKVTGNAMAYISNRNHFTYSTDANGNTKAISTAAWDNQTKVLTALEYVDARESTGGLAIFTRSSVEVHGSDVHDIIQGMWGGSNNSPNYKDKFMGYGGNDLITGGTGEDQITGGAGGDILSGGSATILQPPAGSPMSTLLRTGTARASESWRYDQQKDTFIYNEASDSRIDFNTMRGFDIIAYFEGSNDVINLGKVVDLQGTIKNGNTKGGGGKMAGKAFAVNKAGDTLEKFIDNGDGVFETSASGQLGNNKHSIVLVDTQEDGLPQWSAAATVATKSIDFSAKVQDVNVKWVLVDVDGDGDFDAGVDMAIALVGSNGTVDTGNFM